MRSEISDLRFAWLREVLGEEVLEGGGALFAGAAFFAIRAGGGVEVARAGDGGILQRVGPGAELAGTGFGEGFEI